MPNTDVRFHICLMHYSPELFMNDVVSSRRELADGAEFKTRGTRSQIRENLGHVPEFDARLQIQDLEIQRNLIIIQVNNKEGKHEDP